ncbi:hypothetical protein IU449_28485 [Nocardia higoensis]|uniref:Uncharacterized protein n=1 Tax=Nocardia higoensis TaxID=228599 RepID=A0ABS0DP17_9NOCA|nr:hypothetical protein [Nocardia higoensis]MBF6358438.1 hypothetical protein [Nocardia higoensis]
MNAARATGLPIESSRAARREEAARLKAEQDAADTARAATTAPAAPQPSTDPLPAAPTIAIPMKKRGDKRPFSTQLRVETTLRLAWLVEQGGVLTDTVDAAITAYLDAAGVPRPGPDGTMPNAR